MSTANASTQYTRSALGAMVDREVQRVGSRTAAYEIVAQTIGSSSSWVRKFLSKSEEVKEPRITLFENIRASYANLCARVEHENELQRAANAALKEKLDAITQGTYGAPTTSAGIRASEEADTNAA